MSLLDNYKKKRDAKKALKAAAVDGYTFMVGDQEHDLRAAQDAPLRLLRGQVEKALVRFRQKHGDLVHPETGETPEIVFFLPDPKSTNLQMRLKTDSQELHDWLASKGLAVPGMSVDAAPAAQGEAA